jgi:hypothetical protein
MNRSDTINELAAALAKAQGAIQPALKQSENPYFKSSYADLASVWRACRDALSKNGLAVVQLVRVVDKTVEVETLLTHASGQWIAETLKLPVAKPDIQGTGSAITYTRRYALAAMVGVAPEEDDGNAASERHHEQAVKQPPTQTNADRWKSNERIQAWRNWLDLGPDFESFTGHLHEMSALEPEEKPPVWQMCRIYAESSGWDMESIVEKAKQFKETPV